MTDPDECESDPEVLRRLRKSEWSTITPDMVYPSREELIAELTELGFWPIPDERESTETAPVEGFPISSVAVARVARKIGSKGSRMVSSDWVVDILVGLIEGRE